MVEKKKQKGNISAFQLFLTGGALFSMHFGASSMVWPMNWGKESGTSVIPAFFGAFITSLLLVLIAYIALSKGNGSYNKLTNKVLGKKLGNFYTILTIAILGPLYAIPRMSAAAWDSVVQAFGLNPENKIPLIIFTVVFYVITYFFLMNPGKAMDKISSLLFPFLLVIVVLIVGKGFMYPISEPIEKVYEGSALTTAIGMTSGCAEFFVDASDGKYNYKQASIAILVLSVIFGCLGLSSMLSILGPILDGIYPAAIVLVVFYALSPDSNSEKHLNGCRYSMYSAMVFGIIDMLWKYMLKLNVNPLGIVEFYEKIPFAKVSLVWIPWAIIFLIIGIVTYKETDEKVR